MANTKLNMIDTKLHPFYGIMRPGHYNESHIKLGGALHGR